VFSVLYVAFFVFMFLGETLPVFNNGQVQYFTMQDVLMLLLLLAFLVSLFLAMRWQLLFSVAGLALLGLFLWLTHAWRSMWFLDGFLAPMLQLLSWLLARAGGKR
jgi:hypothetical protein